ncbi:MAG: AbrB family transcriptional regulator [Deltaproteobacteria bacterium]|nr:AbrB family transcriptional regulator [Deltaproteobacteria bacterium]
MDQITGWGVYILIGLVGGFIGSRLNVSGCVMIGAMTAVILFNLLGITNVALPRSFKFVVQVVVGTMIGAAFTPEMGRLILKNAVPIIGSTLVLVAAGIFISFVFAKFKVFDVTTAYLSTSPGAMTALVSLAADYGSPPPLVLAFHVFRVVFIIVTAPFIFDLIRRWSGGGGM